MINLVKVNKDVAHIGCIYKDQECWVVISTDMLPKVDEHFFEISVKKYVTNSKKNQYNMYAGEHKKDENDRFRVQLLHRFITGATEDQVVLFKDGNGLNCTNENMELVSQAEAIRRRAMVKTNKYGCPGVSVVKKTGKFVARIKCDGKVNHLGTFDTVEDAIYARKVAEKQYWGW